MKLRPINLDQLRKVRDGTGHSVFGPSGSGMYLNCSGSLLANLLMPDPGNADAAYGTVAHFVTETWGKSGKRPSHLVGKNEFVEGGDWGHLIWIDDEMLDYAQMCIDWVDFLEGEKYWERRVDFSRITPIPNQTGTADLIIRQKGRLIVVDWKFGKGVMVFAERNTQAMLYALGALWEMEAKHGCRFDEIEIRIGQPRLDHFDIWVVSRDELLEFAGFAKARMALAWQLDAPRVAGVKQCEFCKAEGCVARAMLNIELTEGAFENLDSPHPVGAETMLAFKDRVDNGLHLDVIDVGTLSVEQLTKVLPYRRLADKWWKTIDIEIMRRSTANGEDLQRFGYKIVESRSRRQFKSFNETTWELATLGVPSYESAPVKLVSPAEAERLLIKHGHPRREIPNLLEGLTYKPPGKPTLAKLSDRRQPMGDLAEGVFDNLDTETTETEEY